MSAPHRPYPHDFGSRTPRDPAGSGRQFPPPGCRRISVDLPERLWQDLLACANEDRVSAARWIASATREAVRGHQDGFRFETHGLPEREAAERGVTGGG